MPLVPAALALWVINFIDRQFIIWYKGPSEVGVYSVAIKVASIITFVMVAFRTAWPAFAYSIDDDREARRTYSFVLTYLLAIASWAALGLGALAPWWVALLTNPRYQRAQEAVALLAFAFAIYAGYTVMAIGSGRARQDTAELGRRRLGRRDQHRPELLADPEVGNGRRRDLDARLVRRALRRDDDLRAERLPRRVSVAARLHGPPRRRGADARGACAASPVRRRRCCS